MPDLHAIASRLTELERTTREYVEGDPVQKANTLQETATRQFNAWIEAAAADLESEKAGLTALIHTTRALSDRIDDLGRRRKGSQEDRSCPETAERDGARLAEYNELVQRHNDLVQAYRQKESAYNGRVDKFEAEMERRRADVESVKAAATRTFEAYQRWVNEEGLNRLWQELSAIYVTLMQTLRHRGPSEGLHVLIHRARNLRRVLGAHAMQQRDGEEGGLHVVRATLCEAEECHLLVDCGASIASITPEMVETLGLHDRLGEKVKIDLPNAIRIEAPQLVIPKVTVGQAEADYVKAVVLKGPMPGTDGCLGLSFLDRFDYVIDNKTLLLRPVNRMEGRPRFDVFISHRSAVLPMARRIYDFLVAKGHRPFLSEVSLTAFRTTDYQKAIDAALESVEHLIIVGSVRSDFDAPWVEAEWRLFESLRRAGKKRGNIIPVLSGRLNTDDLPFALGRYEVVSIDNPDWQQILVEYLPRY